MKEFAEYLNDRFPKTRQQLERETGLEDRKVRKAISALKCQQPVLYSNTSRGYRAPKPAYVISRQEKQCLPCKKKFILRIWNGAKLFWRKKKRPPATTRKRPFN